MAKNPDVHSLGQGVEDPKTREAIQQLERLVRALLERIIEAEARLTALEP